MSSRRPEVCPTLTTDLPAACRFVSG